MVERLGQPEAGSSPLAFATEYAQPLWRQYLIILTKNVVCYWRRVAARLWQCNDIRRRRLPTRPACWACITRAVWMASRCICSRTAPG